MVDGLELEERLKSHARSLDGLLSLIPAKVYYGEDVSDQWQRKKQTPEQRRAAKIAKLDPDNWKSAKDVMEEQSKAAAKRKREGLDDDNSSNIGESGAEKTKTEQDKELRLSKKRKQNDGTATNPAAKSQQDSGKTREINEEKRKQKAERRAEKRQRKAERKAQARGNNEKQKVRKNDKLNKNDHVRQEKATKEVANQLDSGINKEDEPTDDVHMDLDIKLPESIALDDESASIASSDQAEIPVFSPTLESAASSISSAQLSLQDPKTNAINQTSTSDPGDSSQPQSANATVVDSRTPKERLKAALSQYRSERKADAVDGKPARNRQELLDQRRRKEEERKKARKEQWRKEKEEEMKRQDEEIARRFSPGGSGSLLASPRSPITDTGPSNNFSFGRIAFEDGTHADPTLSSVSEHHKKRGADTAAALQAALKKKSRLSGLDDSKRKEIEQKDMWLNAKKRAHGERVKDNTSLLKKALKREEGVKKKSEKEWIERKEGVQKSQEVRQKKRTENIQKRKDEKKSGKGKNKVKRPGFEGSLKGRTGSKKLK